MRESHHKPGGGFRNPWPDAEQHGLAGVVKWMGARSVVGVRGTAPPGPTRATFAPARVAPSFAVPRLEGERLSATWIGHSSWLVQIGGLNVLLDPVWSERASPMSFAGPKRWTAPGVAFTSLPPIDLVVLSHDHYDHFDDRTIRRLVGEWPDARWLAPLGVGRRLRDRGAGHVEELDWWEETTVAGLRASCVPAQHFSGRTPFDRDATLWCGWVLRAASDAGARAVWFVGDTGRHPDFGLIARRTGPFDLVLMPVGAYDPRWFMRPVHLDPEDAVSAYIELVASHGGGPAPLMAGMHWGTFRLTDEAMDEPPRRTVDSWRAAGLSSDKLWIPAFGETRRF